MKPNKKSGKTAPPKTHDAYLAAVSDDKRTALEKLRRDIKAVVPHAVECISYQIPAFRLNGKLLANATGLRALCSS